MNSQEIAQANAVPTDRVEQYFQDWDNIDLPISLFVHAECYRGVLIIPSYDRKHDVYAADLLQQDFETFLIVESSPSLKGAIEAAKMLLDKALPSLFDNCG
jgi:hypothetical protein